MRVKTLGSLLPTLALVQALNQNEVRDLTHGGVALFNYILPNASAPFCCKSLEIAGLRNRMLYPGSEAYVERVESYWSETAQENSTCIVQPHNAEEVAKVVSTLISVNDTFPCQFAVRSGGHTVWPGAASIVNGVVVDLGVMNSTTYHAENSTARVLPGARWASVYATLDEQSVAVAGGRAGTVGVGGLVLGGGNSFYAAREGMVCDNVANYEIVLASGEIVNANNNTNKDLFKALKGGSNNFGIVTAFDLMTFEIAEKGKTFWGGVVVYPNSTTPAQLNALYNFTNNVQNDPYASAIGIWQYTSQTAKTIILNAYDYTKPVARPAAYEEFLAIPGNISSSMRITNLTDLVEELEQPAFYRDSFNTLTFKNDIRMYQKAIDLHNNYIDKIHAAGAQGNWTLQDMFQPIPTIFAEHSDEKGGNVLGLDRFHDNLVLWQTYLAWHEPEQDELFQSFGDSFIADLREYAVSIGADNPYIYLNYAYKTQMPLESYGKANVQLLRNVSAKYDPQGVFQYMVPGGFKIADIVDSDIQGA